MTRELVNLSVYRVDLVERAAVRDPDDVDQPARFLVYKGEGMESTAMNSTESYNALRERAIAIRHADESVEQAITRYCVQHPSEYDAVAKAADVERRPEPEPVLKSLMREQGLARVQELARAERRRDPSLSEAQAINKAVSTPAGAEAYVHYARPYDRAAATRLAKADLDLETAAIRLMAADKGLSHAQAVTKACEQDPGLYQRHREAHDAAGR